MEKKICPSCKCKELKLEKYPFFGYMDYYYVCLNCKCEFCHELKDERQK
jgi:hypothetical protein